MRIVEEKVVPAGSGNLQGGKGTSINVKEYLDRVAKYIPAEVIAAYIITNGIATKARDQKMWFILIFFVCLICTPIYITRFTRTRMEAWVNGITATIAFVIWAYAIGVGFFNYIGWYDAPAASIILILFSLISGAILPVKKQKPPKPKTI